GNGSIVNFAGGGATAAFPGFSAYAASKAAVVRFTETIAEEMIDYHIRVNALAPGLVDTSLQDVVLAAGKRAGEQYRRVAAVRESGIGTRIEVPARLAVFLASDESRALTGKLISAPHDPWEDWDNTDLERIRGTSWYTLRRLDPFTVAP